MPGTQTYQPNYDNDVFVDGPLPSGGPNPTNVPLMQVNYPYALSPRSIDDFVALCTAQFPAYAVEGIMAPPYQLGGVLTFSRNVPMAQFTNKKSGAAVVLNAGMLSISFFGCFGIWTNNGAAQVGSTSDNYGVKWPDYDYALSQFVTAVTPQLPA